MHHHDYDIRRHHPEDHREHGHTHEDGHHHASQEHSHDSHDALLSSTKEAAAFLEYTLHHNAHHAEELEGLAHSLEHLGMTREAREVRLAIEKTAEADGTLEAVLTVLKHLEA